MLDTGGDASAGELAVRLAVGEAQVVADNRSYLLDRGVDLSALESTHSQAKASERSHTVILIKNLPHDADEDELHSLFAR